METIKKLNEKYKHFYVLIYYFVIMLLYNTFNKLTIPKYFMHSKIDDYIPFVKEMIIPYLFWYIYIAFSLAYLGMTQREEFYNLAFFMFVGMTICFIIYAIFPNGQNLRPHIADNDIFSKMVKNIYATDKPTNSAPSMHVLDSIAVYIAMRRSNLVKNHISIRIFSFVSMISIIMSTVMIKQHSIIDVVYGILLSLFLYVIIYKFNFVLRLNTNKPYKTQNLY